MVMDSTARKRVRLEEELAWWRSPRDTAVLVWKGWRQGQGDCRVSPVVCNFAAPDWLITLRYSTTTSKISALKISALYCPLLPSTTACSPLLPPAAPIYPILLTAAFDCPLLVPDALYCPQLAPAAPV